MRQMEKLKTGTNKDISPAMRKYLIGKEFYRRLNEAEERYVKAAKENDE